MMAGSRIGLLAAALLVAGFQGSTRGQVGPPPGGAPPFFTLAGSQQNTPGSALLLGADVSLNGQPLFPFQPLLGATDASLNVGWLLNQPSPGAALMNFQGSLQAFPQSPILLAVTVTPGPFPGGNFAPFIPASVPLGPIGTYHLDAAPIPILDGFGVLAAPPSPLAVTDVAGSFPLLGSLPLNTPDHLTFQALLVDPAAPLGVRLTAAFALAKYL